MDRAVHTQQGVNCPCGPDRGVNTLLPSVCVYMLVCRLQRAPAAGWLRPGLLSGVLQQCAAALGRLAHPSVQRRTHSSSQQLPHCRCHTAPHCVYTQHTTQQERGGGGVVSNKVPRGRHDLSSSTPPAKSACRVLISCVRVPPQSDRASHTCWLSGPACSNTLQHTHAAVDGCKLLPSRAASAACCCRPLLLRGADSCSRRRRLAGGPNSCCGWVALGLLGGAGLKVSCCRVAPATSAARCLLAPLRCITRARTPLYCSKRVCLRCSTCSPCRLLRTVHGSCMEASLWGSRQGAGQSFFVRVASTTPAAAQACGHVCRAHLVSSCRSCCPTNPAVVLCVHAQSEEEALMRFRDVWEFVSAVWLLWRFTPHLASHSSGQVTCAGSSSSC